jgi:uncharacterized sulfatase
MSEKEKARRVFTKKTRRRIPAGKASPERLVADLYRRYYPAPPKEKGDPYSDPRPNILLITSDQQHFMTIGVNNPRIRTPNLDRLAARGTIFDRAYTVNPTCTPTRASMITGTYPSQHGAWSLGTKLPEEERVIGQDLAAAAYRSVLIGKAHFQPLRGSAEFPSLEAYPILQDLDFWRKFHGPFYGFDHVELARNHVDEAHVGQHYAIWMQDQVGEAWREWFAPPTGKTPQQYGAWNIPEKYHYNAWISERTNAWLREFKERGENFFLWASFFDPHEPYLVPEPWASMYDPAEMEVPEMVPGELDDMPAHYRMTQEAHPDYSAFKEKDGSGCHGFHSHLRGREDRARDVAIYFGMVTMMDHYIGKILDKLDELGLAENALVVFTTDHGHYYGQHGLTAKGAFHYEDAIKVPFIAALPARIPAGRRSNALQSLVDLPPTFLSVAGLEVPRVMTGVDQKDVWFGRRESARDHVIVENHHQPTTLYQKTYVDERYKLTVYMNQPYGEMFDLREDPGELRNLWDKPECATLKSELFLRMIHADMKKEPVWMPRIWGA